MTLNRKRKSNSSTWQKQFFSIFWTLEINYFDQNLTKINTNNIILQRITRKANWYMMDLMNIEYYEIYCGQRVLMFNIFNCMSVLFLKGKAIRSVHFFWVGIRSHERIPRKRRERIFRKSVREVGNGFFRTDSVQRNQSIWVFYFCFFQVLGFFTY